MWPSVEGGDKCPTILRIPPAPLSTGVSHWPSPTSSQRTRDQPSAHREELESRGQTDKVQHRVKWCDFFPPRILINVGLPVRNGAAIFYLPRGSLREVRFPALEPTVGTINLTNMTGSFSTVRALAKHHSSEEPSLTSLPEIATLQPCPRLPLSRHLPYFLHSTNHSLKLFVYLFICFPLSSISPLRARTLPDSAMALSVVQRITCRMCSINFG